MSTRGGAVASGVREHAGSLDGAPLSAAELGLTTRGLRKAGTRSATRRLSDTPSVDLYLTATQAAADPSPPRGPRTATSPPAGAAGVVPPSVPSATDFSLSPGSDGEQRGSLKRGSLLSDTAAIARTSINNAGDQVVDFARQLNQANEESNREAPDGECRQQIHTMMKSRKSDMVVAFIVFVNALFIGLETDAPESHRSFYMEVDLVFTAAYVIEIVLRFLALKRFIWFFADAWRVFDLLLVTLAVVEPIMFFMARTGFMGDDDSLGGGGSEVLIVLRFLRLFRLMRLIKIVAIFKELWLLVQGIISAMRTLAWTWTLLLIVIYLFAVFGTRMIGHAYGSLDKEVAVYFATVPRSMFSLIQVMTTEGWADIARSTMKHDWRFAFFFILFLTLTTFAMLNVVVAVIVESTLAMSKKRNDDIIETLEHDRRDSIFQVVEFFEKADMNKDGILSYKEFEAALEQREFLERLAKAGLDVSDAHDLFSVLDVEGRGELRIGEFVAGTLRARGEAMAKDVIALEADLFRFKCHFEASQQDVNRSVATLRSDFVSHCDRLEAVLHSAIDKIERRPDSTPAPASLPGATDDLHALRGVR